MAKQIIALGDVHGDLESVQKIMRSIGLIDRHNKWMAQDISLVQVGDLVDRGLSDRETVDFFESIRQEAVAFGSEVHLMLGNHELDNSLMKFDEIAPSSYTSFEQFYSGIGDLPKSCKKRFLKEINTSLNDIPKGLIGRAQAFCPGGTYANLMSRKKLTLILGDTLFVHGGIDLEYSKLGRGGLDELGAELSLWLKGIKFDSTIFKDFENDFLKDANNPLESRFFSKKLNKKDCKKLKKVLDNLDVKRMVVAHTIQNEGINSACAGAVVRIDTGYSLGYHNQKQGKLQALSISDGEVSILSVE